MLTGGGYSDHFKELSKDGSDKLSKSDPHRAQQLAARDRARKLSSDTNRRRRALALKKRLEAQKEAKRREEVLDERRKRQQEATHKFQRLRKGSPRTPSEKPSGKYSNSQLNGGLHIAHGYRVEGANGSRNQYQYETPDLEDALRLVGGHSSYGSHTAPAGYVSSALYQHEYSQSDNSLHQKYGKDSNANTTPSSGSSYHGYSTPATATTYTSNHGLPVKQFQQDLQEQQRKFLEEQAKSLHDFNEEIMKETTPSVLERSDSLSSVDSLEEQPQKAKKESKQDTRYCVSKPSGPAVTVNYYTQGHLNSPANTRESDHLSNYERNTMNGKLFVSNQRTLDKDVTPLKGNQKQTSNELQVEETSETDIVSEAVEERKPVLLQGSSYHTKSSLPRSYADAIGNQYQSRTEPWILQSSYSDSSHVNSDKFSGVSAAFDIAGISGTGYSRTRNVPSKPSATAFTVVPNTNGSNISHKAHQYVSTTLSNSHTTLSNSHTPVSKPQDVSILNRTKERSAIGSPKEQKGVQFNDTPSVTDKPGKADTITKKVLAREPISILKRTSSEQPAKLGGFKVRDSLEISKSSPGRKKSVRWTDVAYEEDTKEADDTGSSEVDNGYEESPSEESVNSAARTQQSTQQSRPKSSVSGRDNRLSSTHEKQKESSKSKPSSNHNSSYATSYVSKKKTECPAPSAGVNSPASKTPVNARNVYKHITAGNKSVTSTAVKNGAVHNANGLRLDKTPTDDEINWLWNKVRTCLSTKEEEESPRVTERPPTGLQSRQPASVTSQCIDGGRITANLRIMSPPTNGAAQSRNNGVPRWRTSSDSGSSLRRTALLHQRRQHSAIPKGKGNGHATAVPRQGSSHQQPTPSSSHQGPTRTVTMPPSSQDDDVSDSLLAFQRAEQLVNDNILESDITVAMEHHRSPGNHDKVPVSALSMEEQRILESLDRLNERLRSVTSEVAPSPYMAITPKPPPFGAGFRGRRPLSSKQHAFPADQAPLSKVRASSADRGNVRINYHN